MIELQEAEKINGFIGEIITSAMKQEINGDFDVDHFLDEVEKEFKAYREEEEIAPIWGYGTYDDNEKKDDRELNPWGSPYGERPKIVECNGEQVAAELVGYRVCQLFPNRDNNTDYYVMFGTPSEIRIQTAIFLNLHKRLGGGGGDGKNIREDESILIGQPKVRLFFKQLIATEDKRPLMAEYSFRLMGYTDDPEQVSPRNQLLNPVDLSQLAKKIKANFWPNGDIASRFAYEKGRKSAIYRDIQSGYKLWLLVKTEADAENLIKKFLAIQDVPYKDSRLIISSAKDPITAFPNVAPEVITLGEKRKRKLKRPEAQMSFWKATIKLSLWSQDIVLVNYDGTEFDPAWLKKIPSGI